MAIFGELFPQHDERYMVPECPIVHYISNQETLDDGTRSIAGEGYHTDHSNHPMPPKATVLHAVKLPGKGGDQTADRQSARHSPLSEQPQRPQIAAAGRHRSGSSTAMSGHPATL